MKDCLPGLLVSTPLCLRAAESPFEGLVIFEVELGEHVLSVRYEHGRWWFIDEASDGDVTSEHACKSAHRSAVLMLRRLRALGFYLEGSS